MTHQLPRELYNFDGLAQLSAVFFTFATRQPSSDYHSYLLAVYLAKLASRKQFTLATMTSHQLIILATPKLLPWPP
jgi:hypothetical protein